MPKKRPLPRQVLAKNLKALQARAGLTGHEIARRAKVDPKTVNNQLHGKYDPRPEQVDAVASVFGLSYVDLLNPAFDPESASNETLRQLTDLFSMADDKGRRSILAVAEMAAGYRSEDAA
jgi:transcriptional regulator with XRE-family HTH domain